MRAIFKIQRALLTSIHADLSRPHKFAAERVGFIACKVGSLPGDGLGVFAQSYLPVYDDHYEDDASVGAMLNGGAFREALQYSYRHQTGMFHVHRHEHRGCPRFSEVDLAESGKFIPDFWKVQSQIPHGALVLSHDSMHGRCWVPGNRVPSKFVEYVVVGFPTLTIREPVDAARPQ
jgi:hypothetical protein